MKINEEEIPWEVQKAEAEELVRDLRNWVRDARNGDEKRIALRLLQDAQKSVRKMKSDPPPVELVDAHEALLERFVEQVRSGEAIDRNVLEFTCQVVEDLLVGRSFDRICPLPGRDQRGKREKQQDRNVAIMKGVEAEMRARNTSRIKAIKTVGLRWGIDRLKTIERMFEERSKKERNVNPQIPGSGE